LRCSQRSSWQRARTVKSSSSTTTTTLDLSQATAGSATTATTSANLKAQLRADFAQFADQVIQSFFQTLRTSLGLQTTATTGSLTDPLGFLETTILDAVNASLTQNSASGNSSSG
jgi:hypothetical protein